METVGRTEGPGDGGVGYGHSGGGFCRVPAACAPPGTTEGGAAERETAGRAEGLGDSGGGGDQDGGGSGTMGDVLEDGQDGTEQPAALRGATASATLPAQRTRAAEGPGSGEETAAGEAEEMGEAPQQHTRTAGKKKKRTHRCSRGARATEGELRKRIPGHQRPSTSKKKGDLNGL